ncbi:MAG TPA: MFS transporter [Burkholderiaceae bacterium]|jgi:MFS family permease|nr:MFS transporter [Burkholderiaceae bacterium]HRZ02128.1 MFS transporter [Burkholderiaceae bacterium]
MTLPRLIVLVVLTHTAFGATRVTTSLYALSQQASAFTVGVLMSLFALLPMVLAVGAGRWIDRIGPRRPLTLGLSLLAAGAALPALFPAKVADVAPLLVSSVLAGTGFMYTQMTVQQLVGHLADPARRATAFSWLAMGFSISGLIGPVMSGYLIDHGGFRLTYLALLALVTAGAALLWRHRRGLPAHWLHESAERPEGEHPFALFRHRPVRQVLVASALVSMAWDLQTFMIPVYGTAVGLSASQVGLVLGGFATATFLIRFAMPWVSRRMDEWQVLVAAFWVAGTAFALMPWFSGFWPLVAVAFLLGLGLGASQPNVLSLLHAISPPGRVGEALGLRAMLMNSSHTFLPLVFGAMGSIVGAGAAFYTMAVMLGAGGVAGARRERHD